MIHFVLVHILSSGGYKHFLSLFFFFNEVELSWKSGLETYRTQGAGVRKGFWSSGDKTFSVCMDDLFRYYLIQDVF